MCYDPNVWNKIPILKTFFLFPLIASPIIFVCLSLFIPRWSNVVSIVECIEEWLDIQNWLVVSHNLIVRLIFLFAFLHCSMSKWGFNNQKQCRMIWMYKTKFIYSDSIPYLLFESIFILRITIEQWLQINFFKRN